MTDGMYVQRGVDWGAFALTVVAGGALLIAGLTSALGPFGTGDRSTAEAAEPSESPTGRPERAADVVRALLPGEVRSELVAKSAPPVIYAGRATKVLMLFRNTGSASWIRGTTSEARLGVVGDDTTFHDLGMAVDWLLPTRPAVQDEAIVLPGGIAQFSFWIKGTVPGRYQVRVGPVIDGVAWSGGDSVLDVTVR